MKSWPVQDAKARFSELLDTCLREGPQIVTKRGAEAAVLVPLADWQRLQQNARPTLKELLLADEGEGRSGSAVARRATPAGSEGAWLRSPLVSSRHQRCL